MSGILCFMAQTFCLRIRCHTMEERTFAPAEITVTMQPEEKIFSIPRPKTVLQLLNRLGLKPGTALVIRENGLLTPDCRIFPNDKIIVRTVTSSG